MSAARPKRILARWLVGRQEASEAARRCSSAGFATCAAWSRRDALGRLRRASLGPPLSRVLFVTPGLEGHQNFAASVAIELAERGHAVGWAGVEASRAKLTAEIEFYSVPDEGTAQALESRLRTPSTGSYQEMLADIVWLHDEFLIPFAETSLGAVEHAIEAFRPAVMAVDGQAFAGALAARRHRLPWATLGAAADIGVRAAGGQTEQFVRWLSGRLDGFQRRAGLDPVSDLPLSSDLVISFSTRDLIGIEGDLPRNFICVGPALDHRQDETPFPWNELREGTRVLVSVGTLVQHRAPSFYAGVCEALRDSDLQTILVAPPELIQDVPANFVVRARVPQLALLPQVDAVVTHAGGSTVLEALAHGLPLVVAPFGFDHLLVADQVVRCGAGIRVRPFRSGPAEIARAVASVLDDPGYRAAAEGLQASIAAAGGTRAAASALETLAR